MCPAQLCMTQRSPGTSQPVHQSHSQVSDVPTLDGGPRSHLSQPGVSRGNTMAGSGPRCLGRGSFIRVHRRFSQNSMLVQAFQRQLEVDCEVFYTHPDLRVLTRERVQALSSFVELICLKCHCSSQDSPEKQNQLAVSNLHPWVSAELQEGQCLPLSHGWKVAESLGSHACAPLKETCCISSGKGQCR